MQYSTVVLVLHAFFTLLSAVIWIGFAVANRYYDWLAARPLDENQVALVALALIGSLVYKLTGVRLNGAPPEEK